MKLKQLDYELTVCKVQSVESINLANDFYFVSKTDEEISLVCETAKTPAETIKREDGWKAFRVQGPLDFSLIGIIARISRVLAKSKIGIFAISTFNTDYILVKKENLQKAAAALETAGYEIE